jgi:hypothetical protein
MAAVDAGTEQVEGHNSWHDGHQAESAETESPAFQHRRRRWAVYRGDAKRTKTWRLRYRLAGKQEKVTLGDCPAFPLAEARAWRDDCKALVARGLSPMALKRGDPIPDNSVERYVPLVLSVMT